MEVAAAETTVEFSAYITHTAVAATTITIEISETNSVENGSTFTPTVNGAPVTSQTLPWTTTFVVETTAEITVPSQYTHITVDGIENCS